MSGDFDPYHRWLGIAPSEQPPHLYRLLGINALETDPEVIRDAVQQRMAHVRTYQLGASASVSQKILNELAAAKACLLDPERKAAYDAQLRKRLGSGTSPAGDSGPIRQTGDARLDQLVAQPVQSGLMSATEVFSCYDIPWGLLTLLAVGTRRHQSPWSELCPDRIIVEGAHPAPHEG